MSVIGKALETPAIVSAQLRNGSQQDSIVLVKDRVAYVVNSERTMIMRIELDDAFPSEIRWRSADWEDGARSVETSGDTTVFRSSQTGAARTKSCPAPQVRCEEVDAAWGSISSTVAGLSGFILVGSVLQNSLNEDLSHVEFWNRDGQLSIKQRDLYGGTLIELDLNLMANDGAYLDIDRVAVRTKDFLGLFLIDGIGQQPVFRFGENVTLVEGTTFQALLGNCIYDDMYSVGEISSGRQEQEERPGEQGPDR